MHMLSAKKARNSFEPRELQQLACHMKMRIGGDAN